MSPLANHSPSTWFAFYEIAARNGDRAAAARALRRLRALGFRVNVTPEARKALQRAPRQAPRTKGVRP